MRKKLLVGVVVMLVGIIGWVIGKSDKNNMNPTKRTDINTMNPDDKSRLADIVAYKLPDGWKQQFCGSQDAVYIAPHDEEISCENNPVAPIKLSVDPAKTKDCNQLQNVSDVKKHTCISLYINNHRSLKALTEYLESSSFHESITFSRYFVDTGKDVIKAEYNYKESNAHQRVFDELVNTIQSN